MKEKFTMLEVNWQKNGIRYIDFFVIPKSKEDQFINNPLLIHDSLDAKDLYSIEYSKYEKTPEYYDDLIDRQYDHYVAYLEQTLMGCHEQGQEAAEM